MTWVWKHSQRESFSKWETFRGAPKWKAVRTPTSTICLGELVYLACYVLFSSVGCLSSHLLREYFTFSLGFEIVVLCPFVIAQPCPHTQLHPTCLYSAACSRPGAPPLVLGCAWRILSVLKNSSKIKSRLKAGFGVLYCFFLFLFSFCIARQGLMMCYPFALPLA